jgi:ACR3 family arsenite transporter
MDPEKAPQNPDALFQIQAEDEKQIPHNASSPTPDPESQDVPPPKKQSAFKSLGWLDRYLAVWILLAIILGVLLGNFVPQAAANLDRGRFVGVSVPIGEFSSIFHIL